MSIQSLILVSDPYFNEPGYEATRATREGQAKSHKWDNADDAMCSYLVPLYCQHLYMVFVQRLISEGESLLFPFYSILPYVVHQTSTTLLYSIPFCSIVLYSVMFYSTLFCFLLNMGWKDMLWYDMLWCGTVKLDLIWFDLIWFDLIWFDLCQFDMSLSHWLCDICVAGTTRPSGMTL